MARRTLAENLDALTQAIEACRGRVNQDAIDRAQSVTERINRRLSLTGDITVVAIAGPTGAGKSTLFNALSRTALAEPGVQRPTTRQAMAVTFGSADTSELLDWLGISRRHVTASQGLDGIVLLDLADYDSVDTSHREEVDRLVEVVDAFLWVVDPQKYADAALHEGYVTRFAGHAEVMAFILNQIDRVHPDDIIKIRADFSRILKEDGIPSPQIFEASGVTGQGLDELRKGLRNVASGKRSVTARLEADITAQAQALRRTLSTTDAGDIGKESTSTLGAALSDAAGVERVGEAVKGSWKRRGAVATGWPLLSWVSGLKTDPLKRLHLDQFRSRKRKREDPSLTRTSLVAHPVSRARVDTAVRAVVDDAMKRLPLSWHPVVDDVAKRSSASLPDKLDQAIAHTDLGVGSGQRWWAVVRVLQWLVLVSAVVGLGWLAVNFISASYLALPELPVPKLGALPLPTWMVIGGVGVGILLGVASRVAVSLGASVKASSAVRHLRKSIDQVGWDQIIEPLNDELRRHDQAKAAVGSILR